MPAVLISLRARQFSAFRPNFESPRRQVRFGTNSVDGTAFELGPQRIGPDTTRAPAQPGSR